MRQTINGSASFISTAPLCQVVVTYLITAWVFIPMTTLAFRLGPNTQPKLAVTLPDKAQTPLCTEPESNHNLIR
jgi:hypothetical protein